MGYCIVQVNAGVWRTDNFQAAVGTQLRWVPVTDQQNVTCFSISYLGIGLDTSRLLATCGMPSNYKSTASELNGAMLSVDGGYTWRMVSAGSATGTLPLGLVRIFSWGIFVRVVSDDINHQPIHTRHGLIPIIECPICVPCVYVQYLTGAVLSGPTTLIVAARSQMSGGYVLSGSLNVRPYL
jgi:hypothetical protein